ncbi:MAG: hypothetical protein JW737_02375 [Acidobacteria bacterium]|nr:hypothetical protein [Acidobacteriota bacterium]
MSIFYLKNSNFLRKFAYCFILLTVFTFILVSCSEEEVQDILVKLQSLEGVTVTEIEPQYGYPRAFQIDITQPVDHNNPNGPQFTQRMYLSHVDESSPMVFAPSGYRATERSTQEIAGLLQANCLNVTHRYFSGAAPDSMDWQYLSIQQAANDHHKIVQLFKTIYTGPWLSSGGSKSGLTCLYLERYFPEDVDVVIAKVAPFCFSTKDTRYIPYLASVGTQEDHNKLHAFQRYVLTHRDDLQDLTEQWLTDNSYTIPPNINFFFEWMVKEYNFSYFQYRSVITSAIPPDGASYQDVLDHLDDVMGLSSCSVEILNYYKPYYYQAFTQLGYAAQDTSYMDDLLVYDYDKLSDEYFLGDGLTFVFENITQLDIYNWLRTSGNNIIYIYGAEDPWTGGAIELIPGQTNAIKIVHPGGDHQTRIQDLAEYQTVMDTIESWLGIEIASVQQRGINIPAEATIEKFK